MPVPWDPQRGPRKERGSLVCAGCSACMIALNSHSSCPHSIVRKLRLGEVRGLVRGYSVTRVRDLGCEAGLAAPGARPPLFAYVSTLWMGGFCLSGRHWGRGQLGRETLQP